MLASTLTPEQENALSQLGDLAHTVFCAPTAFGKTFTIAHHIDRILDMGGKVIYTTLLKAAANQLHKEWQQRFQGYNVIIATSDHNDATQDFQDADLIITMPELLDRWTRRPARNPWLNDVHLIVADEAHGLDAAPRGARLEMALTRIKNRNADLLRTPNLRYDLVPDGWCQIVLISATLGNAFQLLDWLGKGSHYLHYTSRPTPLNWHYLSYTTPEEKDRLLLQAAHEYTSHGGILIFTKTRKQTQRIARLLTRNGIKATAHNAGITNEDRSAIETAFDNQEIQALVATSTLAAGVNLRVSTVIITELSYTDHETGYTHHYPVRDIKQAAGRAGRTPHDGSANVIVLRNPTDPQIDFEHAPDEDVLSTLNRPEIFAHHLNHEISRQPNGIAIATIPGLFQNTLANHQERLPDPHDAIEQLAAARMITQNEYTIHRTNLGLFASWNSLSPATIIQFNKLLDGRPLTTFDFLAMLAASPDFSRDYPVTPDDIPTLVESINGITTSFNPEQSLHLTLNCSPSRAAHAVKIATFLLALVNKTVPIEKLLATHNLGPADEKAIREDCARVSRTARQYLQNISPKNDTDIHTLTFIVDRKINELTYTNDDITGLTFLDSYNVKRLRQHCGITTPDQLLQLSPKVFCAITRLPDNVRETIYDEAASLQQHNPNYYQRYLALKHSLPERECLSAR